MDIRCGMEKSILERGGVRSVSEVSFICGFNDPLCFSKVFKQETGLSPADLLKVETSERSAV